MQASASVEAPPPPAAEAEDDRKIIHIKPPIIVKDLAAQLGIKNHVLIKELMDLQVFANQNQTIEPDIAFAARNSAVYFTRWYPQYRKAKYGTPPANAMPDTH